MRPAAKTRAAGNAAIVGGLLGLALAPFMVMVKYLTGWSIIPEPFWIAFAKPALGRLLTFGSPVEMWVVYGSLYTVALVLIFAGLLTFTLQLRRSMGEAEPWGFWLLLAGLAMVIVGDAVHTATWHQNGLTVPTPGTNPVANTGYAVQMMGMNLVLIGACWAGVSGLRRKLFAPWLGWGFVFVTPAAVLLSLTLLPTAPSGGLWWLSGMMIPLGFTLRRGRADRGATPQLV